MADVLPAGIVMVVGTVTALLLQESLTTTPPGPAAPFNVTVAVDCVPPSTALGLNESDLSAGGMTLTDTVLVLAPFVTVIVATCFLATGIDVNVKVHDDCPESM